jgi:hypothetical protein
MYQWYERAEKCYAYLVDIESTPAWRENLAHCRWLTRGWTLQELIAPADVYFFDQHWNILFQKAKELTFSQVPQELTEVFWGTRDHCCRSLLLKECRGLHDALLPESKTRLIVC